MVRIYLLFLCFLTLTTALSAQRNELERIIRQNRDQFGDWAKNPGKYDVQILYTQIDRDARNRPSFTTYRFGVDANRYFYPASTVKMPVALLALEKLNDLGIVGLDKHTPMRTGRGHAPQTPVMTDPTADNFLPSVAHYVRKIFLVSDNDANNRLYEFLGQRYLNEQLHRKGYTQSRIIHRLSAPGYDTLTNRYTNPVTFYRYDTVFYQQGEVFSRFYDDLGLDEQLRGKGYLDNNEQLVNEPFDFRYRNYVSLQDLHDMLRAVIFPETVAESERFNLTEDDYQFLYRAMAEHPRESQFPKYTAEGDNFAKFWLYGDRDSTFQAPDNIRAFSKAGWAYGFLTDAAYIVDLERGVEFILVGTIHPNENQIYNDGKYEYEEVGMPFFGELGRAIYEYEVRRSRPRKPDLSKFDLFR